MVIESLDRIGFAGPIYPINPKYDALYGRPCYPSVADLPEAVDVLAVCVNHARVLEHMRPAAERGVRAAIIFDGGFAERGDEGRRRQDELVAICREAGIALCGPNCMGVVSPHARSLVYIQALRDPALLAGNVGLIAQSGSICIGLLADCRRFGWSHVISSGNEAMLAAVDFLDTSSTIPPRGSSPSSSRPCASPTASSPPSTARRTAASRWWSSRSGDRSGHSARSRPTRAGSPARPACSRPSCAPTAPSRSASWTRWSRSWRAARARAGRAGRRLAVMTASGGQAELILDLATSTGLSLPPLSPTVRAEVQGALGTLTGDGNPLDAWGNGDFAANFPRSIAVLGADPGYDAVTFCSDSFDDQPFGTPERLMAYARLLADGAARSAKPFYYMTTRSGIFRRDVLAFLREHGIPVIGGTRQGLGAIDRLARWGESTAPPRMAAGVPGRLAALLAAAGRRPTIHEHDAKLLLAAAGLPVVGERLVTDLAEARAAAVALGYPIALKVVSDEIPHRSEHGLVTVGLRDERELAQEWERMSRRLEDTAGRAPPPGFWSRKWCTGARGVRRGEH